MSDNLPVWLYTLANGQRVLHVEGDCYVCNYNVDLDEVDAAVFSLTGICLGELIENGVNWSFASNYDKFVALLDSDLSTEELILRLYDTFIEVGMEWL